MNIAIDVSPLYLGHYIQHRVRGTGYYLRNLKNNLTKYDPKHNYFFFKRTEGIPKDIDVVHYPYFEPYFLTLPSSLGVNYVVTVHDLTPLVFKKEFPAGIKGNIKWQIQKKRLKHAKAIITDSYSSKKDIIKFTGIETSKIHVVHLAAASYFSEVSEEKKRGLIKKFNLPEKFVLYVGDATWNKNLPGLIEAVSKTRFNLIIAGAAFVNQSFDTNNPWNQDLVKAQKLAKQNNKVTSIGFVNDEDLVSLYNAATVFVMPSFYEGFGLPALEAMQSGCPVITSKEGSLEEVCEEAPYYIDPKNINSIKKGIENVMESEDLRKKLSKKGLEQAKKFNWEKTAEKTVSVYEKVLNNA